MAGLPEEVCAVCHKPKGNHPYKHSFVPETESASLRSRDNHPSNQSSSRPTGAQGRVRNAQIGDPVLRLIMLRKGIITVDDLNQVETELTASGVASYEPSPLGESRDSGTDTPDREDERSV